MLNFEPPIIRYIYDEVQTKYIKKRKRDPALLVWPKSSERSKFNP
jgi:hypothetical protein